MIDKFVVLPGPIQGGPVNFPFFEKPVFFVSIYEKLDAHLENIFKKTEKSFSLLAFPHKIHSKMFSAFVLIMNPAFFLIISLLECATVSFFHFAPLQFQIFRKIIYIPFRTLRPKKKNSYIPSRSFSSLKSASTA